MRDQVVECIDENQDQELGDLLTAHAEEIRNMKDENGEWLLIKALNLEYLSCAWLLLSRGANPNVATLEETPAWDITIQIESWEFLHAMFDHGLVVGKAIIMERLDHYDPINRDEFVWVINRFCPTGRRVDNATGAIAAGLPR